MGRADDKEVEFAPLIFKEGPNPATEKVDAKRCREDKDKDGIESVQ